MLQSLMIQIPWLTVSELMSSLGEWWITENDQPKLCALRDLLYCRSQASVSWLKVSDSANLRIIAIKSILILTVPPKAKPGGETLSTLHSLQIPQYLLYSNFARGKMWAIRVLVGNPIMIKSISSSYTYGFAWRFKGVCFWMLSNVSENISLLNKIFLDFVWRHEYSHSRSVNYIEMWVVNAFFTLY
jgi:hypothetical protein